MLGQVTCSATGARTVMSSAFQPARCTSAEVPVSTPPLGTTSALVMPLMRATGNRSLSGLIMTSARTFGLIVPVSCVSSLPSTDATSIRPSCVLAETRPG